MKPHLVLSMLLHVQGHIWRTGFQRNELVGVVFDDVAEALERWHASGIKVYVSFTLFYLHLLGSWQISFLLMECFLKLLSFRSTHRCYFYSDYLLSSNTMVPAIFQ